MGCVESTESGATVSSANSSSSANPSKKNLYSDKKQMQLLINKARINEDGSVFMKTGLSTDSIPEECWLSQLIREHRVPLADFLASMAQECTNKINTNTLTLGEMRPIVLETRLKELCFEANRTWFWPASFEVKTADYGSERGYFFFQGVIFTKLLPRQKADRMALFSLNENNALGSAMVTSAPDEGAAASATSGGLSALSAAPATDEAPPAY